ncbi:MAG: hypothetical protein AMS24_01560 [Chlamydiae bacterium SM23_39]|nr:MAG: hypothetical protein AMS24_01560 [Chlamydiae bacterium SM23_39]
MSSILILPEDVICKIAAGEVITSPACIIKELVENSIDAKAKNIEIEIRAKGMQYIRITDDGKGMTKEDLKKAILRYATSKLKTIDDLEIISTMGFRGEALAAIAAISKIKIDSYKKKSSHSIYVEGGKIISLDPSNREMGTSVEVRSLFYNVPVRKKFQKPLSYLSLEITRLINQLTLSHPEINFSIIDGNKKFLEKKISFEESLKERIQDIFGESFFNKLKFLSLKEKNFFLRGFISDPSFTKQNKSNQFLFLNRRSILCQDIEDAVKKGYGTRIKEKEKPVFILYLDIDTKEIDINVHPQKKEVRFKDIDLIKEKIIKAVSNSFEKEIIEKKEIFFEKDLYFFKETISKKENIPIEKYEEVALFSSKEIIALIDHYLLIRSFFEKDDLVCFDLKASNSRIFFENFKNKINIQTLTVPYILDLTDEEIYIIENSKNTLFEMGFEINIIGKRTISINAIPTFLEKEDIFYILEVILKESKNFQKNELSNIIARKISRFVKKKYTLEEAKYIVIELFKCKEPMHDPVGKKTFIHLNLFNLFSKM